MTVGLLQFVGVPGGFTTVVATSPTGTPSQSPAGSRLIYVSSSTGSDSNAGTISAPFATLAHAVTFLRDGFPDQLLLACGDTWTLSLSDTGLGDLVVAGAGPGIVGKVCTGPMLIGSYQIGGNPSTARPLVLVSTAVGPSNDASGVGSIASNHGDYLVIQGIEFYAYKRDPANAA